MADITKEKTKTNININYKALMYNMPPVTGLLFEGHTFNTYVLSDDKSHVVVPENNFLYTNTSLIKCCFSNNKGEVQYVVAAPEKPIEIELDTQDVHELENRAMDIANSALEKLEEKLILITNIHIFVSSAEIDILDQSSNEHHNVGLFLNKPMVFRDEWARSNRKIEKRLKQNINWQLFEELQKRKECERYNRAYQCYIKSFTESNPETAFCMLITSLDVLFGNRKNINQRIAKYTSILLCEPASLNDNRKTLKEYYKKRSDYVHSANNRITSEDEWHLREFVRKVMLMTFLIWNEAEIRNVSQFYNLLDDIYNQPDLYAKRIMTSYMYAGLLKEQESSKEDITKKDIAEQVKIIQKIIGEAFSSI